jgi:GNAT superfamily N-acetyltransferase
VVGYYSLAAGSMLHRLATGSVRRNMPDPVPVALLGRLAIDRRRQGKGLGLALLRDAILRVVGAAETIGVRAMLVHAISDEARTFYEHWGFKPSPVDPMTLMITIDEARRMLARGRAR